MPSCWDPLPIDGPSVGSVHIRWTLVSGSTETKPAHDQVLELRKLHVIIYTVVAFLAGEMSPDRARENQTSGSE